MSIRCVNFRSDAKHFLKPTHTMDIVKKIKPIATHRNLSLRNKLVIIIFLVSLFGIIAPHIMLVQAKTEPGDTLTFVVGDYDEYLATIQARAEKKYTHEQVVQQLRTQIKLTERVKEYLQSQNSPLADHVPTLLQQNNWKKIVALSNAESSLCKRYPIDSANCWGVGGSDLWKMGDNLDQGLISMNRFLNNYPLRSKVKYAQMSFENMNGLYKQPAREHWLNNNLHVYNELTALENKLASL